jgi:hypothetical protein
MVQSFLAEAQSKEDLDKILDEFLQDKEPRDIVSTNLTVYISPYTNNSTTYTALIIYDGHLKSSSRESTPRPLPGARVTIITDKEISKEIKSEVKSPSRVKVWLANKHVWIFAAVWASIIISGILIYRWVFHN